MTHIVNWLNALTDMDWGWWPFLRLRPQRNENLTTGRVALMSVLFGPLYGAVVGGAILHGRSQFSLGTLVTGIVLMCPVFFILYRLTFAVAWNIRAEKLRAKRP